MITDINQYFFLFNPSTPILTNRNQYQLILTDINRSKPILTDPNQYYPIQTDINRP